MLDLEVASELLDLVKDDASVVLDRVSLRLQLVGLLVLVRLSAVDESFVLVKSRVREQDLTAREHRSESPADEEEVVSLH